MRIRNVLFVIIIFGIILIVLNEQSKSVETSTWVYKTIESSQDQESQVVKDSYLLDVLFINQREKYPTGCESVSTVMALQYFGFNVTPEEFIDQYLEKGIAPYMKEGQLWGSNPWKQFPGNPYDLTGYGCYVPVIYKALNVLLQDKEYRVKELYDVPIQELCEKYIQYDIPVILWASVNMKPLKNTKTWLDEETKEPIIWKSPEHCLLLTGYDQNFYYFNDPMQKKNTAYPKDIVEKAYKDLYSQSVVIIPNHKEIR